MASLAQPLTTKPEGPPQTTESVFPMTDRPAGTAARFSRQWVFVRPRSARVLNHGSVSSSVVTAGANTHRHPGPTRSPRTAPPQTRPQRPPQPHRHPHRRRQGDAHRLPPRHPRDGGRPSQHTRRRRPGRVHPCAVQPQRFHANHLTPSRRRHSASSGSPTSWTSDGPSRPAQRRPVRWPRKYDQHHHDNQAPCSNFLYCVK